MLTLALQKSGRLHDDSFRLLKECGIQVFNGNGQLKASARNFPLTVYFLRDDDIPQYVADGVADAGIVGENILLEKEAHLPVASRLGFGHCRLSIGVPRSDSYKAPSDLEGRRIATSYPVLLKRFLKEHGVTADVHVISGSVEIAPGIGLAHAICDLVSSGSTLLTNGLKEAEVLLHSEALLVSKKQMEPEKQQIFEKLLFRIEAVKNARNNKYIMMNAPNESLKQIFAVLPGMKSPTVVPLAEKGWSSVQSVVNEDVFWDVIERLKELRAEGILVVPIEKMIV